MRMPDIIVNRIEPSQEVLETSINTVHLPKATQRRDTKTPLPVVTERGKSLYQEPLSHGDKTVAER